MKTISIMAMAMLLTSIFAFSFASAQLETIAGISAKTKVANPLDISSIEIDGSWLNGHADSQTVLITFLGVTENMYRVKGSLITRTLNSQTTVNGRVVVSSPQGITEYTVMGINSISDDGATYKLNIVARAENGNAPTFGQEGTLKINFAQRFGIIATSSEEHNFKIKDATRSLMEEDATLGQAIEIGGALETSVSLMKEDVALVDNSKESGEPPLVDNSEASKSVEAEVEQSSERAAEFKDSEKLSSRYNPINWLKRIFSFLSD